MPTSLRLIVSHIRNSTFPLRLVALWERFSLCANPLLIITIAWALLTVPLVFFRGFNSDEGLAVSIARAAVEDGYWIDPHLFNVRFAERPTLLSWIIAAVSLPFGGVNQITARVPVMLFLLGGCLLIYMLLRRVGASLPAAMLGVALFLACPVVQRAYVMTTADMPLAVLLFAAFVLWWIGYERGPIGFGRWSVIGGVLALASLLKGPEPIAYFAFGIGAFILWTRSWKQIPGFVFAGVICVIPTAAWYAYVYQPGDQEQWAAFMRLSAQSAPLPGPIVAALKLVSEILPLALLAVLFPFSRQRSGQTNLPPGLVKAIICYAFVASVLVLFWPSGSAPRYYFPMFPALCVLGGLTYDALAKERPWLVAPSMVVMFAILAYGLIYSLVASPLMPMKFRSSKIEGEQITKLVQSAPAPIYLMPGVGLNVFPYVPGRNTVASLLSLEKIAGPAWIAVATDNATTLIAKRPTSLHVAMPFGNDREWRLLRLDK